MRTDCIKGDLELPEPDEKMIFRVLNLLIFLIAGVGTRLIPLLSRRRSMFLRKFSIDANLILFILVQVAYTAPKFQVKSEF